MTQQTITDEQKEKLAQLSAEFDTEYIKFHDGEERVLQFNPEEGVGWNKGTSEKFGTVQITFNVKDPKYSETTHKWSVSSKKAIHAISEFMRAEQNVLVIKRSGEGNATKWSIKPI